MGPISRKFVAKLGEYDIGPIRPGKIIRVEDPKFICGACGQLVVEGHKCDDGKLAWWLFPFDCARGVVRVLMHGARKYAPHNWRAGMAWSRPYSATIRHLDAWWSGEDLDPETGEHHLDHAICELLFARYYVARYPEKDDRYKEAK